MDRKTEDRVVATTGVERVPEHRMKLVQRREFTHEFATTCVRLDLPFGQTVDLSESRQLEVLIALLEQAFPEVRRAEEQLEGDWHAWRRRFLKGDPE